MAAVLFFWIIIIIIIIFHIYEFSYWQMILWFTQHEAVENHDLKDPDYYLLFQISRKKDFLRLV